MDLPVVTPVGVDQVGGALPALVSTCPDVPYAVPVAPNETPPAEVTRTRSVLLVLIVSMFAPVAARSSVPALVTEGVVTEVVADTVVWNPASGVVVPMMTLLIWLPPPATVPDKVNAPIVFAVSVVPLKVRLVESVSSPEVVAYGTRPEVRAESSKPPTVNFVPLKVMVDASTNSPSVVAYGTRPEVRAAELMLTERSAG